jgi:hypothetical protein
MLRAATPGAILAKQIEQLAILCAQTRFAGGALAQHGGKAVIEEQARTPRILARLAAPCPDRAGAA